MTTVLMPKKKKRRRRRMGRRRRMKRMKSSLNLMNLDLIPHAPTYTDINTRAAKCELRILRRIMMRMRMTPRQVLTLCTSAPVLGGGAVLLLQPSHPH